MRISPTLFILSISITLSITSCLSDMTSTSTPIPSISLKPTPKPAIDTIKGNLRNQVRNLENKMPRVNSQAYIVPIYREQAVFTELVTTLGLGNLEDAAQLTTQINYTLSYYVDRDDNLAVSYLLQEKEPIQKGWGLYAFRVNSTNNIIIEAPHPLSDINTPSIALDIYRALDARALLIAGAHRNTDPEGSTDVAHAQESIFQSVHKGLLQRSQSGQGSAVVLQIHGFNSSEHAGYPQIVIGFGEKSHPAEIILAKKMEDMITKQGIKIGICTGDAWKDLCGTKNIQASIKKGTLFIHIELDEKIRKNDEMLISALMQVFSD